ncbi:hypothetical protein OVN18_07435 [Microcella daejeonensis]|uniref:Right handed beta helix domain-containing protein n=1 Tax=Microcella daejeonensis TaxID=2994971 RepID=A0A9E8MIX6_9MICO|nr:hypothetical protein [Microcella daejeonensis]WAB80409.1 hypothetical protein OVN18_07435 [Microcella daejeonensis]
MRRSQLPFSSSPHRSIRRRVASSVAISASFALLSTLIGGPAVAAPGDPIQSAVSISEPSTCSSRIYVSPTGNNTANGATPQTAWQTVARVNSATVLPGTCVLFEDSSTFAGRLTLSGGDANNAASRVTVGTYITGTPTTATRARLRGLLILNVGGVTVQDLTVIANGTTVLNGIELSNTLGNNNRRPGVTVQRVDVTGFPLSGILIGGKNASNTSKSGFSNVLIQQVDSYGNGDAGIQSFGNLCDANNANYSHLNVTVRQVAVFDNLGVPNKMVPNCSGAMEATNSGNGIVLGDVKDSLIEQSFAFRNGANNNFGGGGPVGIWAYNADNIVIQNNTSYSNRSATKDGGGFDLDGGVINSVMQYNYSYDNTGAGYLVFQYEGARPLNNNMVRYNISRNDGRGVAGGIAYGGIVIGKFGNVTGPTNTFVYGNSIYVSPSASSPEPPAGIRVWNGAEAYFYNNSIHTSGAAPLVSVEANTSTQFLGNNYFRADGFKAYTNAANFSDVGATLVSTLAGWADGYKTASTPGYATTVVTSSAVFVDANNFGLGATSALRNAGVNVTTVGDDVRFPVTRDYFGVTLPPANGQQYSIGASQGL